MKQREYAEGTQALENFKQLATAILQASVEKQKKQPKKAASQRKPKKSDKDEACAGSSILSALLAQRVEFHTF